MAHLQIPQPQLSAHFKSRQPSAIRVAQIKFAQRTDGVKAINTAIGNVSLPMYPAMKERMFDLRGEGSPFKDGVVKYSATVGMEETNKAFLNVISASGFDVSSLYSQITDGGSQAMELIILGVCGVAGTNDKPLLLLDAAYTNYNSMAQRLGRATVSVSRSLQKDGSFVMPDIEQIEVVIKENKPGALLVIPYDNPTGQFMTQKAMNKLAKLCVKHNMWLISDEAYRELHYTDDVASSVWGVTEEAVPGIIGRRMSIETASKVWNACGLRIGALITDNKEYHQKSVAENTANLCSSVIGQYIFGALAHEDHRDLQVWFKKQRDYYASMLEALSSDLREKLPGVIVSNPDASIYSVVDVRELVDDKFSAVDFVDYCASEGGVSMGYGVLGAEDGVLRGESGQIDEKNREREQSGEKFTLLVSPMAGFYNVSEGQDNPGRTQMRIAYVETPENMARVPELFAKLFEGYVG